MWKTRLERGAVAPFWILTTGTNGTFRGPGEHPALQTRLTLHWAAVRSIFWRGGKSLQCDGVGMAELYLPGVELAKPL